MAKTQPPAWKRKLVRWIWWAYGIGLLIVVLVFTLLQFDNLPTFEDLENPKINQASIVYSREGKPIGKYFVENRESVRFKDLNPILVQALIATEDKRYYTHSGIDFLGLGRVFFKTLILGQRSAGGGSTIDQQLAKLLFKRPDLRGKPGWYRTLQLVRTKFKEWIIAVKLNKRYTKEEILAMYLNQFDYLYGANGIEAAAQTYFGKSQSQLDTIEAATLIGMLKNPYMYNPKIHYDNAIKRRNIVLYQMYRNGYFSKEDYERLKKQPIDLSRFRRQSHVEGHAAYFRRELTKWLKELLDKPEYRKPNGQKYDIYRDGLKIYTTIDFELQKLAERVMWQHMKSVQARFDRHWRSRSGRPIDLWTYNADDYQKKIRQKTLERLIRESERYQNLWNQYFGEYQEQLSSQGLTIQLNELHLSLLALEQRQKGALKKKYAKKEISKKTYDELRQLFGSEQRDALVERYHEFKKAVNKAFKQKVKMKVFAYNDRGEKDTVMSPIDSIKYHRRILQIGSLGVDPRTGAVKFWIGGVDFRYFKVDHTTTRRQVGSTFKPFIYATAIALQGISPCQEYEDKQYIIPANDPKFGLPETWAPANASNEFSYKKINLYEALRKSINSISVKLMLEIGNVNRVIGLLHNMGIDSTLRYPNGRYVIPRVPSICLGAADLSVQEMTGAYTTFANNGIYSRPYFVEKITDKNGKVIYRSNEYHNTALNPQYNYVMVYMLMQNLAPYRNSRFKGVEFEVGGKTGTTNDFVDAWFMGITPQLVVGTWVGGEDKWIRWRNLREGQGFANAFPFFNKLILAINQSDKVDFDRKAKFPRPKRMTIELDCSKYKQLREQNAADPFQHQLDEELEEEIQ